MIRIALIMFAIMVWSDEWVLMTFGATGMYTLLNWLAYRHV